MLSQDFASGKKIWLTMLNATLYSIYDLQKFIFNNELNINNGDNNCNDKLYMSDTNMPSLNNSTHL